jgi:hypothetical protein
MKEHIELALISYEEARQVASKDAAECSTSKDYAKENQLTYYLVINTWLMLMRNFAGTCWVRLASLIKDQGLIPTIKAFQLEADRVIRDEPYGPWARILCSEIANSTPVVRWDLSHDLIGVDETATLLFLLRYPKRFSPSLNDKVKDATIKEFIAYENRTKMLQRSQSYAYTQIARRVKSVIADMYPWEDICREIDEITADDYIFSSGASIDAKATLGDKVMAIVNDGNETEYIHPIFGVYTLTRYPNHAIRPHSSKVVAVPKSYKSSRIIAMEPVAPLARGKAIEEIFRRYDRIRYKEGGFGINLEDQSINQNLAMVGSVTGNCATLDASHASDLISKSLLCDLFPHNYLRRILPLLPQSYTIDERRRTLQMASTSGHTLTFRHETIVYYAIALAAEQYYKEITQDTLDGRTWAHAYGDDTIIAAPAYDVACYFFSRLGLIINQDKSFASGPYRESCGKDYLDGMDVSSIYYPRFPVIGRMSPRISLSKRVYSDTYRGKLDNALTMLIELQKRLYPYSYECARFLASVVQEAYPSITTSIVGEVCGDLWDVVESGKPKIPRSYCSERPEKYSPTVKWRFTYKGNPSDDLTGECKKEFDRLASLDILHRYPTESYRTRRQFTDVEKTVYEYWKYISFLKHGPVCNDPLFALLHLTQEQLSISEFFGERTLIISQK